MTDDDCLVCGLCYWEKCDNDADYTDDVVLKRGNPPLIVFDGKVDLCAGHHAYAERTGHMNLKWAALEQAIAKQHA
jgi:hypothetical protein